MKTRPETFLETIKRLNPTLHTDADFALLNDDPFFPHGYFDGRYCARCRDHGGNHNTCINPHPSRIMVPDEVTPVAPIKTRPETYLETHKRVVSKKPEPEFPPCADFPAGSYGAGPWCMRCGQPKKEQFDHTRCTNNHTWCDQVPVADDVMCHHEEPGAACMLERGHGGPHQLRVYVKVPPPAAAPSAAVAMPEPPPEPAERDELWIETVNRVAGLKLVHVDERDEVFLAGWFTPHKGQREGERFCARCGEDETWSHATCTNGHCCIEKVKNKQRLPPAPENVVTAIQNVLRYVCIRFPVSSLRAVGFVRDAVDDPNGDDVGGDV